MEAKLIGKDENTRRFSGGSCLKSAGCFFCEPEILSERELWYNNRREGEAEDFRRLSKHGIKTEWICDSMQDGSPLLRRIVVSLFCVPKRLPAAVPSLLRRRQEHSPSGS